MPPRDPKTDALIRLLADEDEPTAEELAMLADLALLADPLPPPPDGLDRLMAALDAPGPFEHLVGAVADLVAVTRDKARALLKRATDASAWEPGPRPWVRLLHLTGDVGVEGAVVGFVEVEAGRDFPHHTHHGEEQVLILQGSCDDGERLLREGDVGIMPAESGHALSAGDDAPLLYLAVVFDGLEVDGHDMLP